MKKAKQLAFNTIILTVTALIINTLSMSFNVYVSNKIGAEAMGVFQLIMSVYMLAVTLAISGVGLAVTRLVAEELALKRETGAKKAMKKCLIYALSFGVLAAVLLIIFADFIGAKLLRNQATIRPMYVLAVSLPFLSASSVFYGYFTAVGRVIKSASTQLTEQLLRIFIITFLLNLMLPSGLEAACLSIVLGGAISETLAFLYIFFMFTRDKNKFLKRKTEYDKNIGKRMLNISLPVAFSSYIRSALSTVKQVITPLCLEKSGISARDAVSRYGVIRGMAMPLIMFPSSFLSAFGSLLVPEISRLSIQQRNKRITYIISYIFKITLLFSIGVCGIMFFYAGALGEALYKNAETEFFIKALSLLIPVIYFDSIVDGMLKGLNEQLSVVKINILDTLSTIGFIFLLLPYFGVNGYIIVIFISELLNAALSIIKLIKITTCRVRFFEWVIMPLSAIIASLTIMRFLTFKNIIFDITTAALIYAALLFIMGSVKKEDFKIIEN